MWVAKIKLKHDCVLGNRCEKYNVSLLAFSPVAFKEKDKIVTQSFHCMFGQPKDIDAFYNDLKKDKEVVKIERKKNMFFLIEKADNKTVGFFTQKLVLIKPILIDTKGYEYYEIGSWEKSELSEYIKKTKSKIPQTELLKLTNSKIDNIFFPKMMPDLTDKQKQAIELAIKSGYYESPKKISLRQLAKQSKLSLSTYQQHLSTAERKLLPNILSQTN
jgi:predicted DNA binding protein